MRNSKMVHILVIFGLLYHYLPYLTPIQDRKGRNSAPRVLHSSTQCTAGCQWTKRHICNTGQVFTNLKNFWRIFKISTELFRVLKSRILALENYRTFSLRLATYNLNIIPLRDGKQCVECMCNLAKVRRGVQPLSHRWPLDFCRMVTGVNSQKLAYVFSIVYKIHKQ